LTGSHREHVQVHQRCYAGGVALSDEKLDDGDPAAGNHCLTAAAEDLDAALIVPVMQHALEQIEVGRRYRLKEIAADHLRTIAGDVGLHSSGDVGAVEDDSAQRGVALLQQTQQCTVRSADIDAKSTSLVSSAPARPR